MNNSLKICFTTLFYYYDDCYKLAMLSMHIEQQQISAAFRLQEELTKQIRVLLSLIPIAFLVVTVPPKQEKSAVQQHITHIK